MIPLLWYRSLGITLRIVKRISYHLPITSVSKTLSKFPSQQDPLQLIQIDDHLPGPATPSSRYQSLDANKLATKNKEVSTDQISLLK